MLRGFLMGYFLKLSLWSGGLGLCPSLCGRCKKHFLVIRVFVVVVFRETKNTVLPHLYFFPDNSEISATPWTCGHRQITKSRKYCLVHVIVFLWLVFSLIFVSHRLGIRERKHGLRISMFTNHLFQILKNENNMWLMIQPFLWLEGYSIGVWTPSINFLVLFMQSG